MKSAYLAGLLATVVLFGCDAMDRQRPAMGNVTSLVIVSMDSLWAEVEDSVKTALAPRIFAVRDERTFEVTQISPIDESWSQLKQVRQIVLFGRPGDFWMDEVLGETPPASLPAIVEADDVWARGQSIVAVALPAEQTAEALRTELPALGHLLDQRFRTYTANRMFLSDTNTTLRDSLLSQAGFSITLPRIYTPVEPAPDVFAFHNRNEVGGDLFRTIAVSWRPGAVAASDAAGVLAWRDSILPFVYDLPQETLRDRVEISPLDAYGPGSMEVQGVWAGTDPSYPTGGLFIDRIVACPAQDRTYFLEAWMYGPSRRKYEYLIQFQTILDSFRCGG